MKIYQELSTFVGLLTIIISVFWLYKSIRKKSLNQDLLPFVTIFLISAYFDIHMLFGNESQTRALFIFYQVIFPLSAIIVCINKRISLLVGVLGILIPLISVMTFDNQFILYTFKPYRIFYTILGFISVVFLSVKMLQGIKRISEVNVLYFLVATFYLIDIISNTVYNQIFVYDNDIWLNFMWFFLTFLIFIRLVFTYILINGLRH